MEKGHVEVFRTTNNKYHAIWRAGEDRYYYTPEFTTKDYAIRSIIRHKENLEYGTKTDILKWFRNNPGVQRVELPSHALYNMSVPMDAARTLVKMSDVPSSKNG